MDPAVLLELKQLAKQQKWQTLAERSRQLRGTAWAEMLGSLSEMSGADAPTLEQQLDQRKGLRKRLAESQAGKEMLASLLKAAVAGKVDIGIKTKEEAKQAYAWAVSGKLELVLDRIASSQAAKRRRDAFTSGNLDIAIAAYHAGLIASRELLYAKNRVESRRSVHDLISSETQALAREVERARSGLHHGYLLACRNTVESASIQLITLLERRVTRLANLDALCLAAREHGSSRGGGQSQYKWGCLQLEVASTVRAALTAYAAAYYSLQVLAQGAAAPRWKELCSLATRRRPHSVVPNGRDVRVSRLNADSNAHESKLVESVGFVEKLETIVEDGGKRTGAFDLVDPRDGERIRVVLPYRSLDATGLTEGCPVRVNAVLYRSERDQVWRLRLDQLAYSEYRTESFTDAFDEALAPWFQRHPSHLNFCFGYSRGETSESTSSVPELYRQHVVKVRELKRGKGAQS